MRNRLLLGSVLIALTWNFYLDINATRNLPAILKHVAGGQYKTLPTGLRVTYAIQALLVIYQFYFLILLHQRGGAWSRNSYLFARIFLALSAVSTLVNAVSRSSVERWNALAAGLIAAGFYFLGNISFRPIK